MFRIPVKKKDEMQEVDIIKPFSPIAQDTNYGSSNNFWGNVYSSKGHASLVKKVDGASEVIEDL